MRDLLSDPRRERHMLIRALQFHLSQDQPCVIACELIDMPVKPLVLDDEARLLDQGSGTERLQHGFGVVHRHLILELRAHEPVWLSFDPSGTPAVLRAARARSRRWIGPDTPDRTAGPQWSGASHRT